MGGVFDLCSTDIRMHIDPPDVLHDDGVRNPSTHRPFASLPVFGSIVGWGGSLAVGNHHQSGGVTREGWGTHFLWAGGGGWWDPDPAE